MPKKNIREANERIAQKHADIETDQALLEDNRHILEQKRQELDEIISETRQQEDELRQKAKELEPMVDRYTLEAFKRIRKTHETVSVSSPFSVTPAAAASTASPRSASWRSRCTRK